MSKVQGRRRTRDVPTLHGKSFALFVYCFLIASRLGIVYTWVSTKHGNLRDVMSELLWGSIKVFQGKTEGRT